ncbi:MAG: hypothetical protein ICV73_18440 [Acetobacteraceae bacterium]|nr:hypothetical protein [Acetobacteraceae bacterium]
MRGVSGVSKGGAVGGARGASGRSAKGFSLGGTGADTAASATTAATATAAVGGLSLLAVQEDGGGRAGRNAAARRRASSILDELRGLQAELLGGRPDPSRLARLAALQSGEDGVDPGLREAVRAVALRARIELARRRGGPEADRSATVP